MEHLSKEEVIRKVLDATTTGVHSDAIQAIGIYSRQMAIGFAEWVVNQKWDKVMVQGINDDGTLICSTTEQLYELYLQSLNK